MVEFEKLHKKFCAYMHFLTVVGDLEKCCFICRKSVRKAIYCILLCWNEKLWDKLKYYNAIKKEVNIGLHRIVRFFKS